MTRTRTPIVPTLTDAELRVLAALSGGPLDAGACTERNGGRCHVHSATARRLFERGLTARAVRPRWINADRYVTVYSITRQGRRAVVIRACDRCGGIGTVPYIIGHVACDACGGAAVVAFRRAP